MYPSRRTDPTNGWRSRRSMARVDGQALVAPVAAVAPVPPAVGAGVAPGEALNGGIDPVSKRMLPFFFAMVGVVGFRLHEQLPGMSAVRPAMLLVIVSAIVLLTSVPKERFRILTRDRVSRLVLMYVGWAFFTIPTSLWRSQSLSTFTGLAFPVLIIFAIIAVIRPSTKVLDTVLVGFVAVTILLVVETLLLGRFAFDRLSTGATLDSNDLASVAAMGFPLSFTLAIRRRGLARIMGMVGVVILLIGLGKFNSRGGTVAFAAGAVVLVMAQPGVRKLQLFVLTAIAGAAFWASAPPDYRERILGMGNLEGDYNYTSYYGRKAIWERARGYILHNPVLGVGIGAFPVAEGASLESLNQHGKWSATHNAYLQSGAEMGVPGMLLYIAMLAAAAKGAWRMSRRDPLRPDIAPRPEFLASLIGFATGAYFLSHAYFFPMFALLALCSFAIRTSAAESSTRQETIPASPRGQTPRRRFRI